MVRNQFRRQELSSAGAKGDSQRRTRKYENHHSLGTGGILRLNLTYRSVCIGWFARLWLVAAGVLRVSANVLFLRRHRDDPDASRVASATAADDGVGTEASELNDEPSGARTQFTIAA